MNSSFRKTLLAGLAGGAAMNAAMLLTFRTIGFGWNADGFLLDPSVQSAKLIAVWTKLEPLPLVVAHPAPIVCGMMLFAIMHAFLYRSLSVTWPAGVVPRGLRMGGLIFMLTFLFWEFFTPFNQLGEPLALIAIELIFWCVIALAESFAIAAVAEKNS